MRKEYLVIIAFLALVVGLLGALYFNEASSSIESEAASESEVINEPDPIAEEVSPTVIEASPEPFYSEILTENGKRPSVPLGNGKGVLVTNDAIITLHGESGTVYASRHEDVAGEAVVTSVVIDDGLGNTNPSALSGTGDSVLAMWMATDGPSVSLSDNGGRTWGETTLLAERPVGSATPTSCTWIDSDNQVRAIAAWTAPPISGDGGYLYAREFINGTWEEAVRVGTNELASSPSLACNSQGQMMALRDGDIGNLNVFLTIRGGDGSWPEPKKVFKGADPHMAWCGNRIWIGYHGIGAFRAYSDDGGDSWEKETLSKAGKFGAIACDEKTVAITWGDFEDLAAANGKDESKRKVGAAVSFNDGETWEDWRPAGEEVNQSIASLSILDETIAIFWRTLDRIRVTTY
jgi:hypothetical protein